MASVHLDRAPSPPAVGAEPLSWSPGRVHWFAIVAFVGAHAVFGMVSDYNPPPLSTLHAVATLAVAVWLVGVRRNPEAISCIAAYVASSDVLWRMTEASVPWEISKLAVIAILAAGIVRVIHRPRRIGLPLVLLLLLAPSAVVTVERFGLFSNGRERISFELAAHVALVLAVIWFSNLRTERQTLAGILWMIIGPTLAVNTIATIGTAGLAGSDFAGGISNRAASGGYGPNQVSALIGVAAMVSVFLVFIERRTVLRFVAGGLAVWFLAQSVLTFSRGGSFNLVVAFLVTIPFFLRTAQMAVRFFTVVTVVGLVIGFAMIPIIQGMTAGNFGDRFTNSDPTLRGDLMRIELEAWSDNVALGVGVGMMERTPDDEGASDRNELPKLPSHTEFTRLLAEHGLLGLLAILVLIALAVRGVRAQMTHEGRIISLVLVVWCASEVSHSATRLALVPFLFGLAALSVVPDGALQASGDPPGEGEGEDPVGGDVPRPGPSGRRAEHRGRDLPAGGERPVPGGGGVGEAVEQGPSGEA